MPQIHSAGSLKYRKLLSVTTLRKEEIYPFHKLVTSARRHVPEYGNHNSKLKSYKQHQCQVELTALECSEDTEEYRPQGVITNVYGMLRGTNQEA